jgi:hypothetical protein
MSIADFAPLATVESGADSPPRKPWRAPQVIQAHQCPQTAKTSVQVSERHGADTTGVSS